MTHLHFVPHDGSLQLQLRTLYGELGIRLVILKFPTSTECTPEAFVFVMLVYLHV
jgi:hypothetical protein